MPTNLELAELLARAARAADGHRARAYRRASAAALAWAEEAEAVLASGRPLTGLQAIGPGLARRLEAWIHDPPKTPADPPAERRGFLSRAEARARLRLARERPQDLPGDLHCHTVHSDGSAGVAEMAAAARSLGRRVLALTDHSGGLRVPRGMDPAALEERARRIEELRGPLAGAGIELLEGVEMNLSPTGEGDLPPEALAELDVVLGSFHTELRTTADQTDRYLAALANPHIDVLAHPRGRMWDRRPGLRADWPRVFARAAAAGVALEIDCNPRRQDLDPGLARMAAAAGCFVSVGTDAHSPAELEFTDLGLAIALQAGVEPERVLNLMDPAALRDWLGAPRPERAT